MALQPKRISPVAAAVLGLAMVAAGATGGALYERGRRPAVEGAAQGHPAGSSATPAANFAGESAMPDEVSGAGTAALAEVRAEAVRLRERIEELEKLVPTAKTKEMRLAEAKEIVECLISAETDPAAMQRLIRLVGDLDPAMGPYFIEYIDSPKTVGKRPRELYEIALAAGGPEVADWLFAKLSDDGTDAGVRHNLLRVLSRRAEIFSIRSLPVTGPLADLAFRYVAEGTETERRAGACLLGGVATVESRIALSRLATSDPEFDVREQAVRGLALAGDKETIPWLDTVQASVGELSEGKKARMQAAIDFAREELKKRYP